MSKRILTALLFLLLSLGLLLLYRLSSNYVDFIVHTFALPIGALLSDTFSRVPFAVGEALCIALVLGAFVSVIRSGIHSIIKKSIAPFSGFCKNLAFTISIMMLGYALLWAPLYHVEPLPSKLGLVQGTKYTLSELTVLCRDLTESANRLSEDMPDALPPYTHSELTERVHTALSSIEALTLSAKPVKAARYPELLSALGIAGIYFPWTGEAIVNAHESSLSLPFLFTHEAAHQAGYAREDEANYIAYLACAEGDEYFQYSGTMYALYYAMEALHDADTIGWSAQRMQMNEAVQRDYYRMNGLRNAQEPKMLRIKAGVSTAFLRISRQQAARSYGDMVDLLLAVQRAREIAAS